VKNPDPIQTRLWFPIRSPAHSPLRLAVVLATADVGSVGTDGAVAVIVTMAAADFVGSAREVTIRYF